MSNNGKYFAVPFANTGDKTVIPDAEQIDNAVSFEKGFPSVYSQAQGTEGQRDVPRNQTNQIYGDMTEVLKSVQESGVLSWRNDINYAAAGDAVVQSGGVLYTSVTASGPANGGAVDPSAPMQAAWRLTVASTGGFSVTEAVTENMTATDAPEADYGDVVTPGLPNTVGTYGPLATNYAFHEGRIYAYTTGTNNKFVRVYSLTGELISTLDLSGVQFPRRGFNIINGEIWVSMTVGGQRRFNRYALAAPHAELGFYGPVFAEGGVDVAANGEVWIGGQGDLGFIRYASISDSTQLANVTFPNPQDVVAVGDEIWLINRSGVVHRRDPDNPTVNIATFSPAGAHAQSASVFKRHGSALVEVQGSNVGAGTVRGWQGFGSYVTGTDLSAMLATGDYAVGSDSLTPAGGEPFVLTGTANRFTIPRTAAFAAAERTATKTIQNGERVTRQNTQNVWRRP